MKVGFVRMVELRTSSSFNAGSPSSSVLCAAPFAAVPFVAAPLASARSFGSGAASLAASDCNLTELATGSDF